MPADDAFELALRLAGVSFRVRAHPLEKAFIERRFGAYRARFETDVIDLRVIHEPSATLLQPAGLDYPGAVATVDSGGRIQFARRGERLVYDPATRTAEALIGQAPLTRSRSTLPGSSIDTPLRLLLSMALVDRGGLLLHATGFGDDTSAVVFPAHGGGGKTTTASKLPEAHVLSDDQVAVTREAGRWFAHALPFVGLWGRPTVPRSAPLAAVALLAKGDTESLRPLRPAEALARLLACVVQFLPGAPARRAFDTAAALVAEVPVSELALRVTTPLEPWLAKLRV